MNSLQSEFTKSLAEADASLLQTNILLQLMEKSQEVRQRSFSREIGNHPSHRAGERWAGLVPARMWH